MKRPDGRSAGIIWLSTIAKGWDLWAGLVIGIAVGVASVTTGRLTGGAGFYWPLAGLCLTCSIGVFGVQRWLADRLQNSDYGELIGIVDPDHSAATAPYFVVQVVGLFAAIMSAITALVIQDITASTSKAIMQGAVAWLVSWTFLGAFSLYIITQQHIQRDSKVANMRRQYEAEQRERDREARRG